MSHTCDHAESLLFGEFLRGHLYLFETGISLNPAHDEKTYFR